MAIASTRTVELFVAAVEAGNFTRAATRLRLTPAAVSRAIGRYEDALGVRLFRRSTRKVELSDEGRLHYERCREAIALIDDGERQLSALQSGRRDGLAASPRGRVRISAPTTYGHHRLLPLLARFAAAHPAIAVEVDISNRNIDFVAEGFDLAIRAGELADSELVAHRLEEATLGVFAAPSYLAGCGTPRRLEELARHRLVGFVLPSTGRVMPWVFRRRDGSHAALTPVGGLRCVDDFLGCITLARAGAGLIQSFHFLVADDVARGALVEVLTGLAGRTRPFTLLQPPRRTPSAAVRALVDAILSDVHARRAR